MAIKVTTTLKPIAITNFQRWDWGRQHCSPGNLSGGPVLKGGSAAGDDGKALGALGDQLPAGEEQGGGAFSEHSQRSAACSGRGGGGLSSVRAAGDQLPAAHRGCTS